MKELNEYIIQFSGLSLGIHDYQFEIDRKFFEQLQYSEIKEGKIAVNLQLEKHRNMLVLSFVLNGEVEVPCDRCGENFMLPFSDKQSLIVKFADEAAEISDDVITIHRNENELNVAHFIYEYTILALPHKKVHPEGKCDQEILKKLKKLEEEIAKNKTTDARWDGLKNITLN